MYVVCRLCTKIHDPFVLVRESRIYSAVTNKEVCLDELIEQYLSISKQSLMEDASICDVCWNAIEQWHNFRESCLQNEERLKNLHTDFEKVVLVGKEYNFAIEYVEDESALGEEKPAEEAHYEEVHEIEETVQYEEVKELKVEVVEEILPESSSVVSVVDTSTPQKQIDNSVKVELAADRDIKNEDEQKEADRKEMPIRSRMRKVRRKGQTKQAASSAKEATKPKRARYKQATGAGQGNCRLCPICGVARTDMTAHLRWHNNERPYQCPYCPKIFVNSSNLRNHVNLHTRQRMYKCDLCDKEFASTTGRNKHRLTHATERVFLCPVCGLSFKHQASLVRHKLIHNEEPKIKCTECDKVFLTKTRLKKHFLVHLNEKPYNCEVCNKAFNRKDNLNVHIKTHSKQRFNFTECYPSDGIGNQEEEPVYEEYETSPDGKLVMVEIELLAHLPCDVSDIATTKYVSYEKSDSEFVGDAENTIKDTVTVAVPRDRRRLTTNRKERRKSRCSICGIFVINLREHQRMHLGIRNNQCPYCPWSFVHRANLHAHLNIHTRERVFLCDECGAEFVSSQGLAQHRLIHKDREFECDVCGSRFSRKSYLRLHLENVHKPKLNYKCAVCDRTFVTQAMMQEHLKLHDTAVFSCGVCNRAYQLRKNLLRHMRLSHPLANDSNKLAKVATRG